MRMTIILAAALACAALTGCDQAPQAAAPVAVPPPQASVLPPAPAAAPPPVAEVPVMHRRHHHRAWREDRYASADSSESDAGYGYASDSHSSYTDDRGAAPQAGYALWVDGYGRGYNADRPARPAGTMTAKRLEAWSGYDTDCPDK